MAKLRSHKIEHYLEVSFDELKVDTKLPVDIHLYFTSNHHILIWRKRDDELTEKLLAKYRARGLKRVWIHCEDQNLWESYLQSAATPPPAVEPALEARPAGVTELPAAVEFIALPPAPPRTTEGSKILDLLLDPEIEERKRIALAARVARNLLADTVRVEEPELRTQAMAHARDAVRDILDNALEKAPIGVRKAIDDVWAISLTDPELVHGTNVASFAVLFALAFGRISPEVLGDIALAALLHDVGLTQIPANVVQTPWTQQLGRESQLYARHVDEGLRLLDEVVGELSPRVRPLIQQHHEKFDGTGYPMQLQGFQVSDVAQLIAMADTLESMTSGQWDGQTRSLMETFTHLEKLEQSRNHPEYFNPEVFSAVTRWIHTAGSDAQKSVATNIVQSSTGDLLKPKT